MPPSPEKLFFSSRSIMTGLLLGLLLTACGLGMDTQARLERGQQAYDDGEYRAAIIDAKDILQEEPDNAAARLLLGRVSVEAGDGVSGEKELRRAIELGIDISIVLEDLGRALLLQDKFDEVIEEIDPRLASTQSARLATKRTRGKALVGLRQPTAARALFTEVLDVHPNDIEAQLGVASSYVVERNFIQARETIDHVISQDKEYIPSLLASGALGMQTRDTKRAQQDYAEAARLARKHGNRVAEMIALSGLTEAYLAEGKSDEPRQYLLRMQQIAPYDTRTLLLSAQLASLNEDWPTAQEILLDVLKRAPNFRQAQMLLGYVHKESGNLGQAEMYLSAVVAAIPDSANARRLLAETRLQMNKAQQARQALDPMLTSQDADISTLSMAAAANLAMGEYGAATDLLERAVAASPNNIGLQIQLAMAYLRSSEPAEAKAVLEALPDGVEELSEFHRDRLLVLAKMAQGERDSALAGARELVQRWPSRSDGHTLLASVEMLMGDQSAARASFEKASKLDPDDLQPLYQLARLDEIEGDSESAAGRYELILELEPTDEAALVALAKLSARNEDHEAARELLERARSSNPHAVAPRQLLGSLLLAFREFAEAENVIGEALELAPESASLNSMMGYARLNQDNARDAEVSFGRALKLQPAKPLHRLNLAKSQARRGNEPSAIGTLRAEIEQTMQHVPSAMFLASMMSRAGDHAGALDIASELRRRFPNNSVPYALDAELRVRSGDLNAASRAYDAALSIDTNPRYAVRAYQIKRQAGLDDATGPLLQYLEKRPFDSAIRLYLANAYETIEQNGRAISQYERVLQDEPDNFIAANNLAWNYLQNGDSRAEEYARRAYKLKPDNASVADTLGWILVKNGSLDDGIEMLRNADDLSDGRPEIRYHLAAALAEAGHTAEAKSILHEVVAVGNDFSNRREAESLLQSL